jgi:hypothetical protein
MVFNTKSLKNHAKLVPWPGNTIKIAAGFSRVELENLPLQVFKESGSKA